MPRYSTSLLLVLPLVGALVHAAGLPDSGQNLCDNGSNVLVTCTSANTGDAATYPRQDGRFGRDPKAAVGALAKIGGGAAGFDYTKVANNGADLAAGVGLGPNAADWACTRDNITGLMWEVKVNDASHLRDRNWSYSSYNSEPSTNGGAAGTASGGICKTAGRCDTEKFIADVNAAMLCGHNDWRMPSVHELQTLLHFGTSDPAIDVLYFPNTQVSDFWSGSPYAEYSGYAWYVYFGSGVSSGNDESSAFSVRLVRAGQF